VDRPLTVYIASIERALRLQQHHMGFLVGGRKYSTAGAMTPGAAEGKE
jgi:hypothetical protein